MFPICVHNSHAGGQSVQRDDALDITARIDESGDHAGGSKG